MAQVPFMYTLMSLIHRLRNLLSVRVKGGMSVRNGMWHGLRNDIIMQNLIYEAE